MSYAWEAQGITLEHFGPAEFKYPDLMDSAFLRDLDTLRMRCGFPLTINDSARTVADLERIYRKEIAKGQSYPTDSSHVWKEEADVRAVDFEPTPPRSGDGCDLSLEERELTLLYEVLRFWKEGRWKHLGLGVETGHLHADDTPRLGSRRPAHWVAVSK